MILRSSRFTSTNVCLEKENPSSPRLILEEWRPTPVRSWARLSVIMVLPATTWNGWKIST